MVESHVVTATYGVNLNWSLFLALPSSSLATEKARALLPDTCSYADAVANIQNTALLVSAFTAEVSAARIVDTGMRASQHCLGLYILHDITHGLAWPHAVFADRRARQHLANAKIGHVSAAQIGARFANG